MDSKETEELRNDTATDDTVAWNKKRGRRVSFAAEMTSVHVFDRDEDLETPPEAKQDADPADEVVRFCKDLDDSDDFREPKEDDMFGRQPFLQPFESPSPGSAFGSATSNDEDDFFGPVSSEFIRPGRLSDSVASDDNHEITMDSTAFSMHFRSLARSESGDLKTPTGSRLVFEEKTPTQSGTTTVQGSSMELTGYEKSVPHVSMPVDKFGSGKDSSDMSLVEDNPRKYDYATKSLRLDELMSDGDKVLHGVPISGFSDVISATNYSGKKSSTTRIESGSKSSEDAHAIDLENPSVHDSDTTPGRVREELLKNSQSPVHLLVSDSLQYHEQVTEQPDDDKNQSSSPRLDELMSDGNKLLHGVPTSESFDVISATNYSGKKSSTIRIESGSKSSEDAQATDLENSSVHDSDTDSGRVREELLKNSQSPVHLLVSDSLQYHEQVNEQPDDDKNQSSSPRLDELMSDGNKLLHGVPTSESSDVIHATNYSGKKSSTTRIESGSKSSEDAQATDIENSSVHDSDTASGRVREELLTNSRSPVHLLVSDSLQYHEQVNEQPIDDKNQSSCQHNRVSEINEDIDLNDVEAQMPSIRSGKTSELSSPVPSFGLSSQIVPSHIHSRDDLLKQSETTHTNDISYQKFQSHSPAVSYPLTLFERREDIHDEGRHEADTVHNIGMRNEPPLVAITPSAYAMKAQLALDAANSSGQLKITPKNLGGYMLDQARTATDVILNGVSSSICTPVVGDSSIRSKLLSCIVKTPQHVMPVSRLEDQFLGTGQGQIVQKMTADVDNNEFMPSEKLGGSLLILAGTNADVRYSSKEKSIPRLTLDGVFSLSGTPVVGESSIKSKLSRNIAKTPQHNMPASRLEDQFLGTEQGQIAQKVTADVMPSEKLGGSLLNQAGTDADERYSSKAESIPRLKLDVVSSLGGTPVAGHSSIRSKLSSCIVKTPQHAMPVSRFEDQFLGIYPGQFVQTMTADVDGNVFMTPRDRKDFPIDVVAKFKATGGISSQLTAHVKEETHRLSFLQKFSEGTATKSGNISSSLRITHRFPSDKKLVRTPDRMLYPQNRGIVSGMLPPHRDSSHNGFPGSPCGLNHDVVQSNNTVTEPSSFKILHDNTHSKSNNSIKKIFPSQKSSVLRSPSSRYENTLHVELNRQTHSDKAIRMSPGEDGDSMDIMSSGNYLDAVAQKLDNLFMEQDLYSRSPLFLNDHEKSSLQAHPLQSGDANGLLQNTAMLQTPLMSGTTFSVDESQSMVINASKESLLGSSEKDMINIKAPESSVHKRRHSEVVTGSEHSTPDVDKPKSSKVQKKGVNESVKQNDHSDDDQSRCGSGVMLKHWSAILSDVLADSERLHHPTSVERLDLRKIESLEDVVIQLQKVHSVSRICTSIQTQSVGNHHNLARNRRISETKELLQKMLYEQAKLKLIRAKREKLLKIGEIIRSGIRDCQTMKLNCSQLREYNAKAGIGDPQSLTARFEDQQNVQVPDNDILQMRQKVGAAQRDIDSLIYSFHACFKMKEKSTNVDTLTLINHYFKRRALFKSLREDVQLWEINDVEYKKGQNQISLNYHGYLIQRFTLVAPISTVTVSYMLSHPNIEKKYPNMDARIAFSFVFKVDVEQKYVGIRSLAQETQVTSSILSSLLDVIEEVKLARLDVKHLKEARFLSPSAEKLHLCLHFVDFKTAMKVNVALDVSCLTRGIYPSDVLPAQLLPAGLQAAVENLKVGFSRIIRTCRCISGALASSS